MRPIAARSETRPSLPAGSTPESIFLERRFTLTLARADGAARPPVVLEESGLRLASKAGGRDVHLVLDVPEPAELRRAAGPLAEGLDPDDGSAALAATASAWSAPLLALFERWERALGSPGAAPGATLAGVRMEATVSAAAITAARAGRGKTSILRRDVRSSLEGRVAVTLRDAARAVSAEASRWADPAAPPGAASLAGWEGAASEAVARAVERLRAAPPPAMESPALFTPAAAGVLIHEICGHLLEADLVADGASPFAGMLGEKAGPDDLTITDDPRLPGARVRLICDDEGEEPRANVLVERGVVRGFLSDARTSGATEGRSTGNARRESYRCAALPRMTNLVTAPGTRAPEDLLREIRRGVLVERLGRGQVDPRRGVFRLEVESGRMVEDGVAGRAVASAFIAGTCRDLLRAIDGIGSDVTIDAGAGACIKEDQVVPVGQATPSIRVARVKILPGALA